MVAVQKRRPWLSMRPAESSKNFVGSNGRLSCRREGISDTEAGQVKREAPPNKASEEPPRAVWDLGPVGVARVKERMARSIVEARCGTEESEAWVVDQSWVSGRASRTESLCGRRWIRMSGRIENVRRGRVWACSISAVAAWIIRAAVLMRAFASEIVLGVSGVWKVPSVSAASR